MTRAIFAANWKMHLGPNGANAFLDAFLPAYTPSADREVWFFPSAIALPTTVARTNGLEGVTVGAQNVHWEPKGAFTGELSVPMAAEAGARAGLVGHSERRHVFGETDEETGHKVRALLAADLAPMLCVGETIEEREAGNTLAVVRRQMAVLQDLDAGSLNQLLIAYEPVWAIGTGRTATPADANEVHAAIRTLLADSGADAANVPILYGGSVKPSNIEELLRDPEIDGVLVGGASLDPTQWSEMTRVPLD